MVNILEQSRPTNIALNIKFELDSVVKGWFSVNVIMHVC